MKIHTNISQNTEEWDEIRRGKITGSKLSDLIVKRGTGEKKGFYTLMAEQMGIFKDDEIPMERGHRLEEEAIEMFVMEYDKQVERIGFCTSDIDERIALSPDGLIKNKSKYTEAVEIKCLSAEKHLQAIYEKKIPSDYTYQVLQYFIVNDDLETLYFCFYDPRVEQKPFFVIEQHRADLITEIESNKQEQLDKLAKIDEFIKELNGIK